MDSLYFLLIILSGIEGTVSLQCYDCAYYEASSDSSFTNTFLGLVQTLSNDACKLEKEGDETNVDIRTCPTPGSGKVAKCAEIKGTVETSITVLTSFAVTIKTVTRNCIEVDENDALYSDGCHDDLPSTSQDLFKSFFTTVSLGDIQFSGKACYYTSDLSRGVASPHVSYLLLAGLLLAVVTWLRLM